MLEPHLAALDEFGEAFAALPGVVGVGADDANRSVVVYAIDETRPAGLPESVEVTAPDGREIDVPVSVRVVGELDLG